MGSLVRCFNINVIAQTKAREGDTFWHYETLTHKDLLDGGLTIKRNQTVKHYFDGFAALLTNY